MHDPFEQSLRDMLQASPSTRDDDACLGRVLKTANRQVGAGDLFSLLGRWLPALMIALNTDRPMSRRFPVVNLPQALLIRLIEYGT